MIAEFTPPYEDSNRCDDQAGSPAAQRKVDLLRSTVVRRDARIRELEARLRELDHRVRNSLQLVAGLLNHTRQSGADRLDQAAARVYAIARIHDMLCQTEHADIVELGEYLRRLAREMSMRLACVQGLRVGIDVVRADVPASRAINVGLIASEFLINAFKDDAWRQRGGTVRLLLVRRDSGALLLSLQADVPGSMPNLVTFPDMDTRLIEKLAVSLDAKLAIRGGDSSGPCLALELPSGTERGSGPPPRNSEHYHGM